MQFNLVNGQEQVAQFVRRGMAWRGVAWRGAAQRSMARRGMALVLGFIAGGAWSVLQLGCFVGLWDACPGRFQAVLAVSGSFAY